MKLLPFEGRCTVDRAEELRAALLAGLGEKDGITIDLSRVEEADLSFYQLLHSAMVSYRAKGALLTILPNLPEAFRDAADRCGLASLATARLGAAQPA